MIQVLVALNRLEVSPTGSHSRPDILCIRTMKYHKLSDASMEPLVAPRETCCQWRALQASTNTEEGKVLDHQTSSSRKHLLENLDDEVASIFLS